VGDELFGLSCDCSVGFVCFVFLRGREMFVECIGYALVGVEWFVGEVDGNVAVLRFLFVGECFDGVPEYVCVFLV